MAKQAIWITVIVLVVAGLAYPKIKPLFHTASASQTEKGRTAKSDAASATKSGGKDGGGEGGKKAAQLKVSTYLVNPAAFSETVSSTGTLRADEGVELQAETSGKVVKINFEEGKSVKQGELLVKLNDADLKANLDRYTYTKELAVLRERRYATLLKQKVVTQNDYDIAFNDVQVQQAFIDLYKAQIDKTEIRAPFNGVVGLRYVSVGAYVNANGTTSTRIATLQRLDKLKIDFAIPEKYAGRIQVGSNIVFSVAGGEKKFAGQIYAIDPRIDSGTRTLLLRAVCPNSDGRLLPGAFANVAVTMEELPNALLVPSEAVIPGLDEKNVFVMKDGKAERRAVETGSRTAVMVHVLAGLKAGDVVITSGLQQMRPGQEVAPLATALESSKAGDSSQNSGKSSGKNPGSAAGPTDSDGISNEKKNKKGSGTNAITGSSDRPPRNAAITDSTISIGDRVTSNLQPPNLQSTIQVSSL